MTTLKSVTFTVVLAYHDVGGTTKITKVFPGAVFGSLLGVQGHLQGVGTIFFQQKEIILFSINQFF